MDPFELAKPYWINLAYVNNVSYFASVNIIISGFDFMPALPGVSEAGGQTMGHGTGPTMKVMCFNPGSRLKEKSQDAALNH
ncbi:hypothetical protein JOQ06_004868 [Pogonophryne albipinna]|uniref:Uncharacterized protein n=2 Tax=Notothenioidei TaxID=8205 RepID=A0AAD6ARC5_9TELE|nr:hypothetical protein JOQ06_004867 [Pogonophryne albipinna]KAJ4929257.1 hypothetical protein JOQ06_004868 [Pogonophryne albipinna]KAK1888752.1 NADP-reducing hydrogenase subunit HndC [Dissostichus eleginoides]